MKTMKNKIKNNNKRILALTLTLCVILALFAGCTFSSADTCTDPNCTSCSHVVYASEYDVEVAAYIDCPDCTGGGEYVTTTSDCTTCGGDGLVGSFATVSCTNCNGTGYADSTITCTACSGSGLLECSTCSGLGYYDVIEEGTGTPIRYTCADCGGCGKRMGSFTTTGTGYVSCTICGGDGLYDTSRCTECDGSGSTYSYFTATCTATGCDNGIITTSTWISCSTCNGVGGWIEDDDTTDTPSPTISPSVGCLSCGYDGTIACYDCDGLGYYDVEEQGTGTLIRYTCATCGGDGGRLDAVGSTTGTGEIDCPYCTDISYATITFITNYATTETMTATIGEVIPTFRGVSADSYYLTSDSDGDIIVSKSTLVSDDMTLYIWFDGYEPSYTYVYIYLFESSWSVFGTWELVDYISVEVGSTIGDIESDYISSDYDLYYNQGNTISVSYSDIIEDSTDGYTYIYAIYNGDDSDDSSSSDSAFRDGVDSALDNIFGTDWFGSSDSNWSTYVAIALVVLVLLLFIVVFK
ncbi:MAG: hypothetical protein R3Y32_06885 [Bacillota bacterium]